MTRGLDVVVLVLAIITVAHLLSSQTNRENMGKNEIVLVTPCSRPQNLKKLEESIDFEKVSMWYIVYDCRKMAFEKRYEGNPKVTELECKEEGTSGNQCRNMALDQIKSGMVYFLDDDNVIHPDFWTLDAPKGKIVTFNQITDDLGGVRKGDDVRVGYIDTAQFFMDRSLIGERRFVNDKYEADGIFVVELYEANKDNWVYMDKIAAYYNKLKWVFK